MAGCTRTRKGIKLTLTPNEIDLMKFLGTELRRLLEKGEGHPSVLKPFQPRLQRDGDPEAVRTEMDPDMDAELLLLRLNRIESVREELLAELDADTHEVLLDGERADTWLAYLADLRLLVAAVIGITPEDPDPIPEDPDDWTMEMRMYMFLSALQEWMVDALMN